MEDYQQLITTRNDLLRETNEINEKIIDRIYALIKVAPKEFIQIWHEMQLDMKYRRTESYIFNLHWLVSIDEDNFFIIRYSYRDGSEGETIRFPIEYLNQPYWCFLKFAEGIIEQHNSRPTYEELRRLEQAKEDLETYERLKEKFENPERKVL